MMCRLVSSLQFQTGRRTHNGTEGLPTPFVLTKSVVLMRHGEVSDIKRCLLKIICSIWGTGLRSVEVLEGRKRDI